MNDAHCEKCRNLLKSRCHLMPDRCRFNAKPHDSMCEVKFRDKKEHACKECS